MTEETPKEVPVDQAVKTEAPEIVQPAVDAGKTEAPPQSGGEKSPADLLSAENRGLWDRMSAGGKKLAGQIYEKLYQIPGVNRIVGKLEIAYNQFGMNSSEASVAGLRNEIAGSEAKLKAFHASRQEIAAVVEDFKARNVPGVELLVTKIGEIDRQKDSILAHREQLISQADEEGKKFKSFNENRDRVADKLIGHFNEKLDVAGKEIEKLESSRDEVDLLITVAEVQHADQLAKLGDIEQKKGRVEQALRLAGMSETEIRQFEGVKVLEGFLKQGRDNIESEKKNLAMRQANIEAGIIRAKADADSYKGRRDEFARIKEGKPKPVKSEAETRKEEKGEVEPKPSEAKPGDSGATKGGQTEGVPIRIEEENFERQTINTYVSQWNQYLPDKYGSENVPAGEMVSLSGFLRTTRLSGDFVIGFEDFKKILEKFYRYQKKPNEKLSEHLADFYTDRIKAKK